MSKTSTLRKESIEWEATGVGRKQDSGWPGSQRYDPKTREKDTEEWGGLCSEGPALPPGQDQLGSQMSACPMLRSCT